MESKLKYHSLKKKLEPLIKKYFNTFGSFKVSRLQNKAHYEKLKSIAGTPFEVKTLEIEFIQSLCQTGLPHTSSAAWQSYKPTKS